MSTVFYQTILINRLRKNIAFCELECSIRPRSPRCDTWGRRRKPCSFIGSIADDMTLLEQEFGITVDRKVLLNEAIELEDARRERQAESQRRLRKYYQTSASLPSSDKTGEET